MTDGDNLRLSADGLGRLSAELPKLIFDTIANVARYGSRHHDPQAVEALDIVRFP